MKKNAVQRKILKGICLLLSLLCLSCGACAETPLDAYRAQMGFVEYDESKTQLGMFIHNIDSWRAGVTWEPVTFYMDVEAPKQLLGERSMPSADAFKKYAVTDLGLFVMQDGDFYDLLVSGDGAKGVFHDRMIYEAGSDYDILMERAEQILGYRPGDMDFLGKTSVRATIEWLPGSHPLYDDRGWSAEHRNWKGGSITIEGEALQALDAALNGADFSVGNVNCPSDLFLTVEYSDGSSASMAVAMNSFDLLFYRGVCFSLEQDGFLLDFFDFQNSEYYKARIGG